MNGTLRTRTITGVSWSALSQVVQQGFTFCISVFVARILGPKVYGLVGMVMVFTGFAAIFADLGLGTALIQRKDLEERHLNAAFWLNVAVGGAMTLLMIGLAPAVAWFYQEEILLRLTAVIALRYIIDSLAVVQIALLNRAMEFRTLAVIQIWSTIIGGLLGLSLALLGVGPWSLVAQSVGTSVIALVLSWRLGAWRPGFSFQATAYQELFGFSGYVMAYGVFNYWARALDRLLIGRFIGAAALGLYSRAYTLMLMPLTQISSVVGRVMLPALSAVQDDKARFSRGYLRAISVIALITFPMMAGAFASADHFIPVILGDKWSGAIPLFKIFCLVGMLQSITTTTGWICLGLGRSRLYFVMGVSATTAYVVGFLIGLRWGSHGVAWSYFTINLLLTPPFVEISARLVGLSLSDITKSVASAFLCSISMSAVVWGAGWLLPDGTKHWQYLTVQLPVGVLVYVSMLLLLRPNAFEVGRRAIGEFLADRLRPTAS
jgi:O-antigen/teichoic acid export membrane protein